MELKDVVMKLVGKIDPVGETYADEKRLDNLKVLCNLIDELAGEVSQVRYNTTASAYSVKRAGEYAEKYMSETFKE